MKQIHNTNANPVVSLLLSIFVLLGLGHMVIGQTNKGLMILLCGIIGSCLCCVPGIAVAILGHVDAFQCASALQRGETLGENEYKQELLYKIVKVIDKTAVYRG